MRLTARRVPRPVHASDLGYEAMSMITRGFVNIDSPGLPEPLRRSIDKAIEETSKEAM